MVVPAAGFEPAILCMEPDSKSGAFTNFATPACP